MLPTVPETLATEYSMIHNHAARTDAGESYGATTEEGARYRAEILASVGYLAYLNLQSKYPSVP